MSAFLLQFRNPKASLHTRLSDLIKHLQKKGERHCQEFYRALQINAEQLYDELPSRKILKTTDSAEIDTDKERCVLNDRAKLFICYDFSSAWVVKAVMLLLCSSLARVKSNCVCVLFPRIFFSVLDAKVIGRSRRILGFSPIIIGRHVRNICMVYLEDISRN
ncbi:UNVERIFIED_CONTAM: hypothetical protein H355_001394 [Colinus virginianus]|nr:hypothetical protein H355_001394 [Colinus virginianus]